jgi:hypothetical protein
MIANFIRKHAIFQVHAGHVAQLKISVAQLRVEIYHWDLLTLTRKLLKIRKQDMVQVNFWPAVKELQPLHQLQPTLPVRAFERLLDGCTVRKQAAQLNSRYNSFTNNCNACFRKAYVSKLESEGDSVTCMVCLCSRKTLTRTTALLNSGLVDCTSS